MNGEYDHGCTNVSHLKVTAYLRAWNNYLHNGANIVQHLFEMPLPKWYRSTDDSAIALMTENTASNMYPKCSSPTSILNKLYPKFKIFHMYLTNCSMTSNKFKCIHKTPIIAHAFPLIPDYICSTYHLPEPSENHMTRAIHR